MKNKKKLLNVGRCIYCGEYNNLTKEHVVPLGLNGEFILENASCLSCNNVTSKIENDVLRRMLFYFRAYKGRYKTRRPKERPSEIYISVIDYLNKKKRIKVDISDYGAVAFLPDFKEPEFLSKEENKTVGVQQIRIGGVPLPELMNKYSIKEICMSSRYRPVDFARMLAKISYGLSVAVFGLDGLEECYCLDAILGKKREIGRWVGKSKDYKIIKRSDFALELFIDKDKTIYTVIRLFSKVESPTYKIVVGRIKNVMLFTSARCFIGWLFGTSCGSWYINDKNWDAVDNGELKGIEGDFFLHDHKQNKTIKLTRES